MEEKEKALIERISDDGWTDDMLQLLEEMHNKK